MSGCDPDFGWSDGADGSGKCYMVIKNTDYTWVQQTCQRCLTMLAPRGFSNIAHSSGSYTCINNLRSVCLQHVRD